MIVEYTIVNPDGFETFQNTALEPGVTVTKEQWLSKEDKWGKLALDMTDVEHFQEARAFFNDQEYEAVTAKIGSFWTPYLIISYENFKAIYEKANNLQVHKAEDQLTL